MNLLTRAVRVSVPRPIRNWLRSPIATARALRDTALYLAHYRPTVTVRGDWKFRCHPTSYSAFAPYAYDADFGRELDGFIRRCRPGMSLLDVGANYGLFTLAAGHFSGGDCLLL